MTTPALTTKQAEAILDTVKGGGIFEGPIPTDPKELLKTAAELLKQAESAKRAGVVSPAVLKVIEIGLDIPFEIDNTTVTEPAQATTTDVPSILEPSPALPIDNDSREDTAAVSTDATLLERDQEQESSHYLDPHTNIDIPTLPRDFSKVDDLQLRSLHAQRSAVLSKVIFELGLEEADYQSAQVNYDNEYKMKQRTYGGNVTERREQAFIDSSVVDWRDKVDQHHRKVTMLRAYKEILEHEIKDLSREFTMRLGERTA